MNKKPPPTQDYVKGENVKGDRRFDYLKDKPIFYCRTGNCNSTMFGITREGVFCQHCGAWHGFNPFMN